MWPIISSRKYTPGSPNWSFLIKDLEHRARLSQFKMSKLKSNRFRWTKGSRKKSSSLNGQAIFKNYKFPQLDISSLGHLLIFFSPNFCKNVLENIVLMLIWLNVPDLIFMLFTKKSKKNWCCPMIQRSSTKQTYGWHLVSTIQFINCSSVY